MRSQLAKSLAIATALHAAAGPVVAAQLSGTVRCKGVRDNANAVVYVEAIPGKTFTPPREPAVVDQKGMQFLPHVRPVLVGSTVDFLNSDPVLHNVFTPAGCAEKFNLGTWKTGEKRSFTFKKECVAALLCRPHPEMLGYVVAVPTPYFAVTDKEGKWSLPDVPEGQLTLKVWHPKLKPTSKLVTPPADRVVDFELSR